PQTPISQRRVRPIHDPKERTADPFVGFARLSREIHGSTDRYQPCHYEFNHSDHVPIVKTTRNLTLPLCICSYASATRSNGYFSIIGCTPVNALNSIVSCESRAVPEYQPATELRWLINENILIDSGSTGAAGTSNRPLGAKPSTNGEIAAALGA